MHRYSCCHHKTFSAGNSLSKVCNRNTRNTFEKCSKLTIKSPKQRHWHFSCFCYCLCTGKCQVDLKVLQYEVYLNPYSGWAFLGLLTYEGDQKGPSLKSITCILQWWNLAQLYLTLRRSKKYMNYVTHPWVLLRSVFFHCMSAKMATLGLLKKIYFEKKVMTS